ACARRGPRARTGRRAPSSSRRRRGAGGGSGRSCGRLRGEVRAERVEELAGAVLALGRIVEAVEERALLGEEEAGAAFGREELDRGQRGRQQAVVDEQVIGEDDPLVGDDVVV